MNTYIVRQFLRDSETLKDYRRGLSQDTRTLLRRALLRERSSNTDLPDHFYMNWKLKNVPTETIDDVWALLSLAFNAYKSEYLHFHNGQLYVHFDKFGAWQHELAGHSPLPIIAYAFFRKYGPPPSVDPMQLNIYIRDHLQPFAHSSLLTPYEPTIEELIEDAGLNEIHVHLNGSTEVDTIWQDALANPRKFMDAVDAGYAARSKQDDMLFELYDQIMPGLNTGEVAGYVRFARRLRIALAASIFDADRMDLSFEKIAVDHFMNEIESYVSGPGHPVLAYLGPTSQQLTTHNLLDILLLVLVYDRLENPRKGTLPSWLGAALHAYLLVLNVIFVRFCVQQVEQRGFDQFQKLTVAEMRATSEREYVKRFHQMNFSTRGDLQSLEGRFSPPDSPQKLHQLLQRIVWGYEQYLEPQMSRPSSLLDVPAAEPKQASKRMQLRLVAHFIKCRDQPSEGARCRFDRLRTDVAQRWRALCKVRADFPAVRHYVTGLDAAANELHTPPEVFAPIYRAARRASLGNFTYHVGEDFTYLVSGIRAVYEAIKFLDLEKGNRLGHATAIGIDPKLYLDRLPERLVVPIGERLDDLVFALVELRKANPPRKLINHLQSEVNRLGAQIYGEPLSLDVLHRAWRLRYLNPLLLDKIDSKSFLQDDDDFEATMLREAKKNDELAFRLFVAFHSTDVIRRSETVEEIDTRLINVRYLRYLQRAVMNIVLSRGLILEALPTSNVRISFYRDYHEHHIYEWLGCKGAGPTPIVCVGSDDPGIFACNLRSEYMHLYRELRRLRKRDDAAAKLRALNEAGRLYAFGFQNA